MSVYYQDEQVTLHHGDALAVLAQLETASVDALITDPPYSSGGLHRGDRTPDPHNKYLDRDSSTAELPKFAGDSRDQRAYGYWCALWLSEALRVVCTGGIVALFTDWRQIPITTDALQAGGFVWRGLVPWVKPSTRPQPGRFAPQCEYIAWGSAGDLPMVRTANVLPGFYQAAAPRDKEHITQKPVDVMRQIIQIVPEGGTILDPFMGSGTTGVAAVLEGRRFVGVEITEPYAEIAERRIRVAEGHTVSRGDQLALDFEGMPDSA